MPTWNAIYLGTFGTDIDPTEGNDAAEDANVLIGQTFGSAGDPLFNHVVEVTTIDNTGFSTVLETDTTGVNDDQFSFDLGSGPQVSTYDSVARYDVTVTYFDGTQASLPISIFQDTAGNLFLASHTLSATHRALLEAKAIESMEIDAFAGSFFVGMPVNQTSVNFVCYVAGTWILTPEGERPVETLGTGDLVLTADRGPQPIRWIRSSRVIAEGKRLPVLIRAGALGRGLPRRDLRVSRQHRILIASPIVERMFGCPEVLVPALRLVGLPGIEFCEREETVSYWHLLTPCHDILFAEGAPAETLLPGPNALDAMEEAVRAEILSMIPDAETRDIAAFAARPIPAPKQQKRLIERHAKNRKPLLSDTGAAVVAPVLRLIGT